MSIVKTSFRIAAVAGALAFATPSIAASFVSGTGNGTNVTLDSSGPAFSWTINYNGFSDSLVPITGLTSSILYNFVGTTFAGGETTYNFQYQISNTSSAPITASRVSMFGFNTNPNLVASGASSTGIFGKQGYNSNVPNIGDIEVCFHDRNGNSTNCAGGSGGGVDLGQMSTLGTFSLKFAGTPAVINLSDFYVRYQSIEGAGNVTSAVGQPGTPTSPVPEPATWLMMLAGFGIVGAAMRRRNSSVAFA